MKTALTVLVVRSFVAALLAMGVCLGLAPGAHAGLTLEMNLIRYDHSGYSFSPYLNTNNTPANIPFGDYQITSSQAPTNGAFALYRFDTNGFNQVSGVSCGYSDFDSAIQGLTNHAWSIFVTNSIETNVYHFDVTANIDSNSLPVVTITSPANGAVNVTDLPDFTWQGPANYSVLAVYEYNYSSYLPATQTHWLGPRVLYQGMNSFTVHYDSNSVTAVVSSVPLDSLSHPISSWVSTAHLQDYVSSQFTVGTVDVSGTNHTLVAHYAWDGTNGDGSASGADTSGSGDNMNFSDGFGSQGGANSTTAARAGPRAIQFHDGDGKSAGYVGWNPTPANLLSALAGSFSVSCWIKTSQNNFGWDQAPAYYGAGIVSADNGGLANDVIPLALTGSKIGFNTGGDVEDVTLNSSASVNDGDYHHIVVTRNQLTGQKIIYIDGVLDSFSSGTTNPLGAPQKLTIGALANASDPNANNFNYNNGYDGFLDDLQIYSGVLSASEVAYLYNHPGTNVADVPGLIQDYSAALDGTNLNWATAGDTGWFVEATNTYDGVSAAQSGIVTNDQTSVLSATVTGPGTLTFWWQAAAGGNFDYEFDIDGISQNDIFGIQSWIQAGPYPISEGTHTLTWKVSAFGDNDPTEAGYLDQVNFDTTPPSLHVAASPTYGPAPLTVHFTSPSVDSAGNAVTNWNWNFGDGATSTAQNPSHTYANLGAFSPSLVATSANVPVPLIVTGPGLISATKPLATITANLPGSPANFTYHNFINPISLQFLGSATSITNADGPVIRLTPSAAGQAGAAYSAAPITFAPNGGFGTFFSFRLSQPGGLVDSDGVQGADGIAFIIQSTGYTQGVGGGGLGYAGISNSLAVEFDTYYNGTQNGVPGDFDGNHVAVNINGVLNDPVSAPVTHPLNNGNIWYAWIDYSGVSKRLEVRLSEIPVRPLTNILATAVDLPAILGQTNLPAADNLLTNGDFESEPNWGGGIYYDGSATALTGNELPGWTIEPNHAATIHQAPGPYLVISDGYSFNTDGEGYGGHNANIYQDFRSVKNLSYDLNFDWQSWGYFQPITSSKLKVTVTDTVTAVVLFTGLYNYEANTPHLVHNVAASFLGTGNSLRLRIEETPESGQNDNMFVVDNFSVGAASPPYIKAFVGFTAGTGTSFNQQDILSWKFMALPTAHFTSHFALSNVPPNFNLTNGIALKRFIYHVHGVAYTNLYLFEEEFTEEPDGSVDAATEPESTPVIDAGDGGGDEEDMALMNEYVTAGGGGIGSGSGSGIVAETTTPPPDGTLFNQTYPGFNEADLQQALEALGSNPPPPSSPAQNQSPQQVQNLMNAMNQDMNNASSILQQLNAAAQGAINNIGYSGSVKLGTVTVREQLISAPPLQLILLSPRAAGTNFSFGFLTVSNLGYTVWSSTNLATANWVVSTNFVGDGYSKKITNPAINPVNYFYRASSP